MELSDGQFEQLVGMLADNRTAIRTVEINLMNELEKTKRDLRAELQAIAAGQTLLSSHIIAVEEDLGKVQIAQRGHTEEFLQIHQALDGLTQLGKSTWDISESLQKHIHGEDKRLDHVADQESQQP